MKILVCLYISIYTWETGIYPSLRNPPDTIPPRPPATLPVLLRSPVPPLKKEIISDKEKYINNSTNRMRKKESYTQWDLPTKKLISHNTGTLCRIFRCGNWSEPSCHHSLSALNNLLHVFSLWTIILDCYQKEHTWAILAMTAAVRSLSPTCWGETFFFVNLLKFIVGVY